MTQPQRKLAPASSAGRVPPHDLDAEAAVLAAVLLAPRALDEATDLLVSEQFYSDANGMIFEAAIALRTASQPVDIVSIASWLRSRERLAQIGGPSYLAQLADATPSIANVGAHARVVKEKWRVRQMIATCQMIAAEGYGDIGETDEWLGNAEASVAKIAQDPRGESSITTMKATLQDVYAAIERGDRKPGLATGLFDLDRLLGGMRGGQLILIAAHSGIGKSALALNVAVNVAGRHTTPLSGALIFSAEMQREELAERALFAYAQVDAYKIQHKDKILREEWTRLSASAQYVGKQHCWIDDSYDLSPLQIRARTRRIQAEAHKMAAKLAVVVVDYVQLLNGKQGLSKDANREAEVGGIGRSLKSIAKERNVPVVALAQLNADASARKDGKPRMSDLRESKALGMHADKIILIHNPHAVARAQAKRSGSDFDKAPEAEEVDLIVDKNRGGRTGTVQATFFPHYTLFDNASGSGGSDDARDQ